MLDLALYSGATMLAALAGSIIAARRKAWGESKTAHRRHQVVPAMRSYAILRCF